MAQHTMESFFFQKDIFNQTFFFQKDIFNQSFIKLQFKCHFKDIKTQLGY